MKINRRKFVQYGAGCVALATGLLSLRSLNLLQSKKPNLILFIVDDMRYGMTSYEGHPVIQTPNLDKLAADGYLFSNSFVTTPICPVSRASILTGNYALNHRVYQFNQPLPEKSRTFLKAFKDKGYKIGYVGKWGVGNWDKNLFDFDRIDDRRSLKAGLFWVVQKGVKRHLTDLQTSNALSFLRKATSSSPFLLVVSYSAVHGPFTPPKRFASLYKDAKIPVYDKGDKNSLNQLTKHSINRQNYLRYSEDWGNYLKRIKDYYRLIAGVDESVGSIIKLLRDRNLYDKTGMIFTSDNGFMLGDHGLWGKAEMYDASLRVPFIVKPPKDVGAESAHIDSKKLVLNLDVPATLLGMAGITPYRMDGRNVLTSHKPRQGFYCELIKNRPYLHNCEAYRDNNYKYMRYYKNDVSYEQLFDLVNDPEELNPLDVEQNRAILEKYRQIMNDEKVRITTS
ncbi:MAG: sulfatase-like hydrolase/transferase [Alphaproteobacteria bacterium]